MSRRDLIRMTDEEQAAFLDASRVVTIASIGPNGRPHLMPLWFVVRDGDIVGWTYASSQKTKNLERLPEATLLIEAGEEYQELRGVQMECDATIERDTAAVTQIGLAVALRYAPGDMTIEDAPPELVAMIEAQAAKRVGLRFTPTKTVTWDHRKLGGTY
jgi:PPOX class probable F420-dependent enzyme